MTSKIKFKAWNFKKKTIFEFIYFNQFAEKLMTYKFSKLSIQTIKLINNREKFELRFLKQRQWTKKLEI